MAVEYLYLDGPPNSPPPKTLSRRISMMAMATTAQAQNNVTENPRLILQKGRVKIGIHLYEPLDLIP